MLVVTKLDRLARSVADASSIARHLHTEGVTLNLGGEIYNPTGALMFHVLAVIAEFEANLISARTREGMAIAKKKESLKGNNAATSSNSTNKANPLKLISQHSTMCLAVLLAESSQIPPEKTCNNALYHIYSFTYRM